MAAIVLSDPSKWTVAVLKTFCGEHGLKKSGKKEDKVIFLPGKSAVCIVRLQRALSLACRRLCPSLSVPFPYYIYFDRKITRFR